MANAVEIMRENMRRFRHWLAHLLGRNFGKVETWWEPDPCTGKLMIGFRCDDCERIEGIHEALIKW